VVSWPAANGQGLDIRKYSVTAISAGGGAPVGDVKGTSLTIKDGELEYGQQYAFTVVAINEHGAGSKASPISNSIVPFTTPGKPEGVDAATAGDQAGAVKVTWSASADNGRPITKYVVTAGGKGVADTRAALTLQESTYPAVQYVPLTDVDQSLLERTATESYCPFKGEASYYSIPAGGDKPVLTTQQGIPVADDQNTLRVGPRGPALLEDFHFREKIFHFDHERIPERVVHARGYGAHGFFETYESLAEVTKADIFQRPGERTPVFVRFSTVAGSRVSTNKNSKEKTTEGSIKIKGQKRRN